MEMRMHMDLLWALNKADDLGSPAELCNLTNVPAGNYPIVKGQDPNVFINSINSTRAKSEILDTNDLYYKLDCACVDARINNLQMAVVHPWVVYESHYALNWLTGYMRQDWDNIS
jgi:hypothetical protein